ncbi:hypothetical protein ADK67_06165 [Saccharothrix sp. NRRL B-16348]|nr:hypothetical protein ADK67_06165 [Saccharothrix sp. NRRL B-16348]
MFADGGGDDEITDGRVLKFMEHGGATVSVDPHQEVFVAPMWDRAGCPVRVRLELQNDIPSFVVPFECEIHEALPFVGVAGFEVVGHATENA